jgi:hypothetical protein
MKKSIRVFGILSLGLSVMAVAAAAEEIKTDLSGYQETPATINSTGSGEFNATISKNGTMISYTLTYKDLSSTALQSHIHFGQPATSGGVVLFLCTNLTPPVGVPTPPACPPAPATVKGTLTAANVIALPAQGIDSGAVGFAEMLEAIEAAAAYVNVHTTNHPGGEIRGRLQRPSEEQN